MDSFLGFVDWLLTVILWFGIPLSLTSTIVHHYFTNVKPDSGALSNEKMTATEFLKDIIKFVIIAVISWVAIYIVRDVVPAAGSTVVGGLGF